MSLPQDYNLLALHPNKYYIETGIYRGDSLQMALDAGFEQVIGIDNDLDSVAFCHSRFDLDNFPEKMILICGQSHKELHSVVSVIDAPATIFLDAHWQMTGEKPENAFPLLDELAAIRGSGQRHHTIIIDDLLYMTHHDVTGWSKNMIRQFLRSINSKYKIKLLPNPIVNNLLIATP